MSQHPFAYKDDKELRAVILDRERTWQVRHFALNELLRRVSEQTTKPARQPGNTFSTEMPDCIGLWEFKCMETNQEPERVAVTWQHGGLWVHNNDTGTSPVKHFHDGLTQITWRFLM